MWRVLCLIGYSRPSRHQGGVALNPSGKTCGIVRFSGGGGAVWNRRTRSHSRQCFSDVVTDQSEAIGPGIVSTRRRIRTPWWCDPRQWGLARVERLLTQAIIPRLFPSPMSVRYG